GAARKAAEEVQLVRGRQRLEGPETGRKRHQRDGGGKLRRDGNRLDVCMPGRRCCPRKLTGHIISFQSEPQPIVRNYRTRVEVPIHAFSASPILAKRQDGTLTFEQGCQSNPKESEFGTVAF